MYTSCPVAVSAMRLNRSASAEKSRMMSSGSIELPRLLDILRPWLSRTVPCRYTRRNGTSPMNSSPAMIMRETQKKMISGAVTKSSVG